MDEWRAGDRTQHWRASFLQALSRFLAKGNPVALALVRITATRPGVSSPSLLEQEGLLARAMACVDVVRTSPVRVEPLSLQSFALIQESTASIENLNELSDQLRAAVEKHLTLDTAFDVKVTMGLACAPHHAETAAALLRAADAALSYASEEGEVSLFSEQARQAARERETRGMRLKHAIEREELVLHYQPQVDPRTGRPGSFESLIRWNLDGRLLAPGEFFPLAGDAFFLGLGEFTMVESLRQLADWRRRGMSVQRVAVNLLAQQLRRGDLEVLVRSALSRAKLEPGALEIELVETHLVEQLDRCGEAFESLRALGVRVAIDDFGTGYSSLSYLNRLPVDVLKIDRSIAADVVNNPISNTIVSAINDLAKGIQLTTVAEGVEQEDQYLQLATLGCDRLQGYWISRPKAASDLDGWIADRMGSEEATIPALR